MKTETHGSLMLAPREERAVLDQIRNDHELIERLGITPRELEALSKCALLGTLTCKEDMLFILRQIREATSPAIAETSVFFQPARVEPEGEEDRAPDFRQLQKHIMPALALEPPVIDAEAGRSLFKRLGILVAVIAAAGLLWNGIVALSRWHTSLIDGVGTQVARVVISDHSHLDRLSVLVSWEALLVGLIVGALYLRSVRGAFRLKIRPGRGY